MTTIDEQNTKQEAFWERLHDEHPEVAHELQRAQQASPAGLARAALMSISPASFADVVQWAHDEGWRVGHAAGREEAGAADESFESRVAALEQAVLEQRDTIAALQVLVGQLLAGADE